MNNRQDRVQRIGEIASAIVDGIAPDYVVLVGGLPIIARRYLVDRLEKKVTVNLMAPVFWTSRR